MWTAVIVLAVAIASAVFWNAKKNSSGSPTLAIAGHLLKVEIADTEEKQQQGLSGRDSLPQNSGMLFIMPMPGRYTFWMKDMKFPIDLIWIKDGKVVDIIQNAKIELNTKDDDLLRYVSVVDANMVLEVNAGFAEKYQIKSGDAAIARY